MNQRMAWPRNRFAGSMKRRFALRFDPHSHLLPSMNSHCDWIMLGYPTRKAREYYVPLSFWRHERGALV